MNRFKGAIFDVDGTLLDSMPMWDSIAADYLRSKGKTPRDGLNDELIQLGGHEIPEYFQSEYGVSDSVEDIMSALNGMLEDFYSNTAPLKDGVLEVLKTLHFHGVKMCVATATDKWLVEPALKRCGILDYFGRIFTCGEEKTSKSSPEIYVRAAAFLGTAVSETLVFEDALYAIESAKKAGFPVAAVYDHSAEELQDKIKGICDYYYTSLNDFSLRL